MSKNRPVIITCAVTGAIHTPSMSPHLPITAQEIADAAIGAAEAGAAIVHLHARDPIDGRPSQDPALFAEFLPHIKAASDVVINITTGGAPTMGVEERLQPVMQFKPELASLNMGSMNFGLYEMLNRFTEFKHDWERPYLEDSDDRIFRNTFRDITHILNSCAENRTRFEIECYDIGHLYTAAHFLERGLLKPPLFIQSVFGLRGGIGGHPEDLEVEVEGELRLLTYSLTPVSHTEGHILGAVMVLHDVTEQRAFERVRSEFVLRASHELRTPVTGMHMAFGLFRERAKFPAESREADLLDTVNEEMQRLMQLINDLLNFSRYQNGLQKLTLGPCDVNDLLEHARARFAEPANAQNIELLVEAQADLPRLYADQPQLERVLDNLLANALRHTAEGGQIRLQARRHGERVIVSVEDNGEGIAYGQQGRIFEPFVQVGRKKGGAGLGLALCKEIVQLHGGRMGVYSRPGQGTQFYMALPL